MGRSLPAVRGPWLEGTAGQPHPQPNLLSCISGAQNRKEDQTQEGKLKQKRGLWGASQNDWDRENDTMKYVHQDLSAATHLILILKTVLLGRYYYFLFLPAETKGQRD